MAPLKSKGFTEVSRIETLRSLEANVKAYHGLHRGHPNTPREAIVWVRKPQPERAERIMQLFAMLGLTPEQQKIEFEKMDNLKAVDQFEVWLNTFRM